MAEYALVRELGWRTLPDGTVEVESAIGGATIRYREGIGALLEDVRAGKPIAELRAHFPRGGPDRGELRARQFLLQLRRLGYVDIPIDDPSFPGYAVERELGRGGVGIAWLCRDEAGRRVVVKRAWDFLAPLEVAEAALRAEDAALQALRHPGIVARLSSFERDGRLHLVREYVEGPDLGAHERAPIEAADARARLAEAARIVAAAHEQGHLLLDLRPGNFVRGDRLVLLDVGFARPMHEGAVALERPVGAAGFVAPETLRALRATPRSDVWALGALYAFLRTGHHAPDGNVLALAARLPEADSALVSKLCDPDPARRPDAAALA